MQFRAQVKYVKRSASKLRPIVDVVRGTTVQYALDWLTVYPAKKALPIKKVVQSAVANAKQLQDIMPTDLKIAEIKVDQGPTHKYYKPAAMGRSMVQRKRSSHITVVLEQISKVDK